MVDILNKNVEGIDIESIINDFEVLSDNRYKYFSVDEEKTKENLEKYYDEDIFKKIVMELARGFLKESTLLSDKEFLNDLFVEAKCGLLEAASKFDDTKNNKFMTYAYIYIRKYIFKFIKKYLEKYSLHTSLSKFDSDSDEDIDDERKESVLYSNIEKDYFSKYSGHKDIETELQYNITELLNTLNDYYKDNQEDLFKLYVLLKYYFEDEDISDIITNYDYLELVNDITEKRDEFEKRLKGLKGSYPAAIKAMMLDKIFKYVSTF